MCTGSDAALMRRGGCDRGCEFVKPEDMMTDAFESESLRAYSFVAS